MTVALDNVFNELLVIVRSLAPCCVELHAPVQDPLPATLYVYRDKGERLRARFGALEAVVGSWQAARLINAARKQ